MDENGQPETVFEEELSRLMVRLDEFMTETRNTLQEIQNTQDAILRKIRST